MAFDKDIRFSEKRVDESYKEQAARDKGDQSVGKESETKDPEVGTRPVTSKPFMNLVSSLGVQVLMHLGELPNPATGRTQEDLQSARELIDLLMELKKKTLHNTSPEEDQLFDSLLPELQMKFSQKV